MRRGTPLLTVDDLTCSGTHYRPSRWRAPKTGGGRVSATAPFDKLTTAPAWTGEACATGPVGLLARPAGRVERVNAGVAKEELRATPVVRPAQPAIRQTTPGVRRTARRLGLEPTLPKVVAAKQATCGRGLLWRLGC